MNAITFDKDGYVRRLTDAGADERLAVAIASYGDYVDTSQLATKTDLKTFAADVRTEFADVRTEMRSEFANVRTEISDVRTEMRTGFAEMNNKFADVETKFAGVTTEFGNVRSEMKAGFAGVATEFASIRTEMANLKASVYASVLAGCLGIAGLNVALIFAVARLVAPQ